VALVVDNRAAVQGAGVHALIVGVSNYLNLPDHDDPPRQDKWFLNRLTSPSLSALKIFDFIQQQSLRLPIKTIRLLLSPSVVEMRAEPRLLTASPTRANRAALEKFALDWRDDAKTNSEDMTILYFAGHGMQRGSDDGVLLLEDFLAPGPPLAKCFEIGDIRNGMAPTNSFPNIAMTQFYFVDACLAREETLVKFQNPQVPDVFGAELGGVDRRATPTMFSTVDGGLALGRDGKLSHFAEALQLAWLRGADEAMDLNGSSVWPVTSVTIARALELYYQKNKLGVFKGGGGVMGSPIFRYLASPPDVDISVQLQPGNLNHACGIEIRDPGGAPVGSCGPTAGGQYETTVKAGIYSLRLDSPLLTTPPYKSDPKYLSQKVFWPWTHNLTRLLRPPQSP
jgi:caspase domain-containing protein